MKSIFLLTSCLLLFIGLRAQTVTYKPFPNKKASWVNQRGTYITGSTINWRDPDYFTIDGRDTIINGLTYSKVAYYGGYHGALRDDKNGKVFYIPINTTKELLIYDFSIHKNDQVVVNSTSYINGNTYPMMTSTFTCTSTDTVLINGSYRKRINFSGGISWIEGIGNTLGLFAASQICTCEHDAMRLVCMSEDNTTLFPSFSVGACLEPTGIAQKPILPLVELFPNPTTGKFQILIEDHQVNTVDVINLIGQVIYTTKPENNATEIDIADIPPGIYYVRLKDVKQNITIKKIVKQ